LPQWLQCQVLPSIKINVISDPAKTDVTYTKVLQAIAKIDLLILDDREFEPFKTAQRNDLMETMDDRYGSKSTVIISQPTAY